MVLPILRFALEPAAERQRRLRLMRALICAWSVLIAIAAALWFAGYKGVLLAPVIMMLGGISYWLLRKWADQWEPDWHEIARTIEHRHPDLHALLLTAVEQRPDPQTGEFHFLQQRVIQSAVAESRRRPWIDAVPSWKLAGVTILQWILVAGLLFLLTQVQRSAIAERQTVPFAQPSRTKIEVSPGKTEVERGTGMVVLARFSGEIPSAATLILQPRNGVEQRIELTKNMDDPVFGGALAEVTDDLEYRVLYGENETESFQVKVFEHPRLERADARLVYPDYTKLPAKEIPDTRRVTAVQGTKLDYTLSLNKPVRNAKLIAKDGTEIPLQVEPEKAVARLQEHEVKASGTYTLHLEDAEGRNSKVPAQFSIEALPNRRPEVKLALPKGDQRVSPLQEVGFQQEVWDDFGILAYGVSYTLPNGETKEMVLGREVPADQKVQGSFLLKLEQMGVKPDELLSWMAWAEDIGPDGKPRRTMTDMYFGEVRPFEEIYRRGDDQDGGQPAGGEGGGGGPATQLAQLQKQIITATWNLLRLDGLEPGTPTFEKYQKDEPVLIESQKEALKQAKKMADGAEQPKAQALVEAVTQQMEQAVQHLEAARESVPRLGDALQSERGAYNALLKLASHEFNVRRGSQQNSQGRGQSGDRQQQLDQLDLKDDRKRYETKSEAAPQQNEEQREQLAILNRLKELAQRQQDINERLKELQTALQEAKSEQEQEEVRRQLKRLREEEQQLLADMDETRQRMDSSQNPSQFAEDRRRMEQTRSEAQQAAEAMERQDPSSALASGTRAGKELEQMRDDLRKKTSGQFREEMRELRADARELSERQKELAEQLDGSQQQESGTPSRRSLDGSSPREQLAEQFNRQGEQLKEVQERMQQLSDQAEVAEPLLARELYDTLRKAAQAGTQETLERAGQLARRGFTPQARDFEQKARQEIEDLKGGVERAAESVLGDEAEALRLARAELDALTNQLNRELAQADPKGGQQPGEPNEANSERGQQATRENAQQGEPGNGRTARQQEGEPQPSERDGSAGRGERREGQQMQSEETGGDPQGNPERGQPGQQPGRGREGNGEPNEEGLQPGQRNNRRESRIAENNDRNASGSQQTGQAQDRPGESPDSQNQNDQQGNQPGQGGALAGNPPNGTEPQSADGPGSERSEAIRNLLSLTERQRGGIREGGGGNGGGDQGGGAEFEEGPIRGEGFVQWSDRLRNVEEMLDDPKLRSQVAQVREVARGMRAEFKRHSKEPEWEVVRSKISRPLAELRNRVTEELARRESRESLVPIDRDPVPSKYAEHVRRYYEELGRSR